MRGASERQGHLRPQRPAALQDKTAGRAELPRYSVISRSVE
jgi:hypothetical protein